jgi:hypothetical protein
LQGDREMEFGRAEEKKQLAVVGRLDLWQPRTAVA